MNKSQEILRTLFFKHPLFTSKEQAFIVLTLVDPQMPRLPPREEYADDESYLLGVKEYAKQMVATAEDKQKE